MELLDAFFNRGFRGAKCKTLLKLTIPRIKLLRNRKELQLKQMRKDIAKLLETGLEGTARIRVEHLIRENKIMEAHEIIELYCELIVVRLPIIETQRECPLDLKEAISSLCFAAPRCSDLPELLQIQMMFSAKYGKEFVAAATELMPESGVNRQIIELLSVRAPPVHERLKLLKEIAEEHELDWDPTDTETEFMKRHEDLLNGANHFADAAQLPLPKEKYDGSFYSAFVAKPSDGKPMPETGSEFLNLPTVSQSTLHPNYTKESFPTVPTSSVPSEDSTTPPDRFSDRMRQQPSDDVSVPADFETSASSVKRRNESSLQSNSEGIISSSPFTETRDSVNINMIPLDPSNVDEDLHPSNVDEDLHFGVTPDAKRSEPASYGATESSTDTSLHSHEKEFSNTFHNIINTPLAQKEKLVDEEPPSRLSVGQSNSSIYKTRTVVANDLQDVLEAAQQAAETADHAAAAARLAATLAQSKIAELSDKQDDHISDNGGKSVLSEDQSRCSMSVESEKHVDNNSEPSFASDPPFEMQRKLSDASEYPCYDTLAEEDSSALGDRHGGYLSSHQPSRSTSMEDDPFSYPNLFSSQDQYAGADHSPRHN